MKSLKNAIAKLEDKFARKIDGVIDDPQIFDRRSVDELSEAVISRRVDYDLGSTTASKRHRQKSHLDVFPNPDKAVSFEGFTSSDTAPNTDHVNGTAQQQTEMEHSEHNMVDKKAVRIVTLPLAQLKLRNMVTPDVPKSAVSEEFRRIKRPLMSYATGKEGNDSSLTNIIMVSSCVEGEGKTTTAMNLAMSIAMEREKTVLLIDADVEKAVASTLLGFSRDEHGLTDLLKNTSLEAGKVIFKTDVDNFRFMPAGTNSDHSTELLASLAMSSLLEQLSSRYPNRVIIMDAPPVLLTSEAIALAEQVGQIVFVVAAETTRHGMVLDALSRINGTAKVGMVLNKMQKSLFALSGYSYGDGALVDRASQTAETSAR